MAIKRLVVFFYLLTLPNLAAALRAAPDLRSVSPALKEGTATLPQTIDWLLKESTLEVGKDVVDLSVSSASSTCGVTPRPILTIMRKPNSCSPTGNCEGVVLLERTGRYQYLSKIGFNDQPTRIISSCEQGTPTFYVFTTWHMNAGKTGCTLWQITEKDTFKIGAITLNASDKDFDKLSKLCQGEGTIGDYQRAQPSLFVE